MLLGASLAAVVRLRPALVEDSYGDPVESWDFPSRIRLRGADIQAVSSTEQEGTARRLVEDARVLFVPGVPDLTSADRIETEDGEVWRVDGNPVVRRGQALGVYTTATLTRAATS